MHAMRHLPLTMSIHQLRCISTWFAHIFRWAWKHLHDWDSDFWKGGNDQWSWVRRSWSWWWWWWWTHDENDNDCWPSQAKCVSVCVCGDVLCLRHLDFLPIAFMSKHHQCHWARGCSILKVNMLNLEFKTLYIHGRFNQHWDRLLLHQTAWLGNEFMWWLLHLMNVRWWLVVLPWWRNIKLHSGSLRCSI